MRQRDRVFLIGLGALAVLVVVYMFWVSPEKKNASALNAQVAAAQSALTTAQQSYSSAASNKQNYATAYDQLLAVGKAVPPNPDVPSLIYEIDHAADAGQVQFDSITSGGGSSATGASAAATPTSSASFTPLSFTFEFSGTFFQLYHLLGRLNEFDVQGTNGNLGVSGRLLTITGATLTAKSGGPAAGSPSGASSASSGPEVLNGTITATAYTLPSTGTSGSSAPAGSTAPTTGSTTPTTPAVIQATP